MVYRFTYKHSWILSSRGSFAGGYIQPALVTHGWSRIIVECSVLQRARVSPCWEPLRRYRIDRTNHWNLWWARRWPQRSEGRLIIKDQPLSFLRNRLAQDSTWFCPGLMIVITWWFVKILQQKRDYTVVMISYIYKTKLYMNRQWIWIWIRVDL